MHRSASQGLRGRSTVVLACALVSVSAMLPVACGFSSDDGSSQGAEQAVSPKVDEAAARKAYADFEQAGKENDATAIVALISKRSADYYGRMRDFALTATKSQLTKRRLVDQVTVLSMRADAEPAVLRDGDLAELVAIAVAGDNAPVQGIDTAKARITITGDTAKLADADDPEVTIDLVREDKAWKVDVLPVLDDLNEALLGLVEMSGRSRTAFVEQSLAQQIGSAAKAKKLWTPIDSA